MIASESFRKRCVADDSQADRCNGGAKDPASHPLQDQGYNDDRKARPECNRECAQPDRARCECDEKPFGSTGIEEFTPRQLAQQTGESVGTQHEPNALLVPSGIGEKNSNERAEPRLHPGEKEIDRVKAG